MFAVFLLCVLLDHLCLTPAMGCAHMDDHRAYVCTHSCQRRLKKTESNKVQCCGNVDGQAQTLLLTRVAKKLPPPGVLAICQLHKKCLINTLKTVRTRPSRSTSAVVNSLPSSPAQARHSDLRTNYKQFRLQIENQPANHARSTNVHRARHAHAEIIHTV